MVNPIRVGLASGQLLENALLFMNDIARRAYNCDPPPPPDVVFAAAAGEKVVGTMAFDIRNDNEKFPLEYIFSFDLSKTPFLFRRSTIAKCARWMASVRGVSGPLLYVAALYALQHGKEYGIGEIKDDVAARFKAFGVQTWPIADAILLTDKIPMNEQPYYITPPVPQVVMVRFQQMEEALRPAVMQAVAEGLIILA